MNILKHLSMSDTEPVPEGISEIVSEYSKDFRRIHVNGIYGHISPSGIESIIYSEETMIDDILKSVNLKGKIKIKRIAECYLSIDPIQMKAIHNWLGTKIIEYEKVFGKIPIGDELNTRVSALQDKTG